MIESPNAEFVVVGVGVNVGNRSTEAPPELRERVVSLAELVDANVDNAEKAAASAFDVDSVRTAVAIRVVRRIMGRAVE